VPLIETRVAGAHGFLVDGLINDAGKVVRSRSDWFDMSTLREPYRAEGKKTMGYELAEQLGWALPDAVIYPTGGGTGLVGMWKAFDEMERLGWIDSRRPKMFSVQAAGCAPIVRAYDRGERHAELWQNAHTIASGLRVPVAIGDYLMLDAIRGSGGSALTVTDDEIRAATDLAGSREGIWLAPEGAATVAAVEKLLARGEVAADDRIVLFNTGSGMVYPDLVVADFPTIDHNAPVIPGLP
jgi:threonine synthase